MLPYVWLQHVIEGKIQGIIDEEEEVSSCWMTLRKIKYFGI
jgi:hypothetical protein